VNTEPSVVRADPRGPVLLITIHREAKRNAIDEAVTAGIDAALNALEDDASLRVGILTGGSSMFSAGTDLAKTAEPPTHRGGEYGVIRRRRTKPLIAAVEGFALGGGFEVVLARDLVVASRTATLGLPEVQRSLLPIGGGLFRPVRALPLNIAREVMLTGDPIDATRAHALGLVNRLVEPGATLDAAIALAQRICENGPVAIRESMAALDAVVAGDDPVMWALSDGARAAIFRSQDAAEGRNAFLERRSPVWSGR
jgi:enoyl-CoA hydratase